MKLVGGKSDGSPFPATTELTATADGGKNRALGRFSHGMAYGGIGNGGVEMTLPVALLLAVLLVGIAATAGEGCGGILLFVSGFNPCWI